MKGKALRKEAILTSMTFLAPSFLFVFLPIVLSVYSITPKYLKPYALPAIGIIFYSAINLKSPFALIMLPVVAISVIVAVELYKKKRIRICLEILRIVAIVAIFSILVFRIIDNSRTLSGIGVIILLMSAVSLCSDVLWGDGRVPDSSWDTLIYLTFFPLFMVGPFVKYGDFVEKVDRLDFNIENFTSGVLRFTVGFLKCVAVSAVLGEAYSGFFAVIEATPGVISLLLLVLTKGIEFFFFVSGYSDIAVGIASMLGIRIADDHGNFFCNVTPCEFIRNFFSGLLDFCRSYITVPVSLIISGKSGTGVAAVFAAFFYALVFSNNMETVYTLMIPLSLAMILIVIRTGKKRKKVALLPKILGCAATLLISSGVIWYIYMGGPDNTMRLLEQVSFYPMQPRAIAVIGDAKYIVIPLGTGLCVWAVKRLFRNENAYLDAKQRGDAKTVPSDGILKLVAKYAVSALLLILFVFAVIMILPQYPYLAGVDYFFPFV